MRYNGGHKVKNEADRRSDSQGRPPDSNQQAYRASELTSCQKGKVVQRNADRFVDHLRRTSFSGIPQVEFHFLH